MIDNIYLKSPIITERLCITADELLMIRDETNYNEMEKMTCRSIIKKEGNGELIGKVSFNDYNPRNRSMELGYYIIKKFRKNGYMSEALTSLLDVLFEKIKINKDICSNCQLSKIYSLHRITPSQML